MLDVCAYYRIYILNLVKAAEQGPITFFYDRDVKFPAIPFTTIGKSFQALKFGFDLPIPNAFAFNLKESYSSSVNRGVR